MSNTGKHKEKLGHTFIDKLSAETKCISFINNKEQLACSCSSKVDVPMDQVKTILP